MKKAILLILLVGLVIWLFLGFDKASEEKNDVFIEPNDPVLKFAQDTDNEVVCSFSINPEGQLEIAVEPNKMSEATRLFFNEYLKSMADAYIRENCGDIEFGIIEQGTDEPNDLDSLVFGALYYEPSDLNTIGIIFCIE